MTQSNGLVSTGGCATGWQESDSSSPVPFWRSVFDDIVAHISPESRPATSARWILPGLGIVFNSSGFHTVLVYRIAHQARMRLGPLGRLLGAICFWFARHWYGCSFAPTARIYGALILPHPQGIVIGPDTLIGPRCWIFQNVTLGGAPGKTGSPRVGCDARIFAGAVITGPVVIGDEVVIGANTVVAQDIPSASTVRPTRPDVSTSPRLHRGAS
jgi:serine acetyltransferase